MKKNAKQHNLVGITNFKLAKEGPSQSLANDHRVIAGKAIRVMLPVDGIRTYPFNIQYFTNVATLEFSTNNLQQFNS